MQPSYTLALLPLLCQLLCPVRHTGRAVIKGSASTQPSRWSPSLLEPQCLSAVHALLLVRLVRGICPHGLWHRSARLHQQAHPGVTRAGGVSSSRLWATRSERRIGYGSARTGHSVCEHRERRSQAKCREVRHGLLDPRTFSHDSYPYHGRARS